MTLPVSTSGRDGGASDLIVPADPGSSAPGGADSADRNRDEQAYLDALYRRLDGLRSDARAQLDATLLGRAGGSPQARTERDVFAATFAQRLARLDAVEEGLCFGRLDLAPGAEADPDGHSESHPDRPPEGTDRPGGARSEPVHIGRIGVSGTDQRILLVDWRAPAAEPFYRATAASPMGVRRRRHLRTRGRRLTGFDDEIFDLTTLADGEREELTGEAALLAALAEARTGRMRDVVATLQAEQDRIVRADARGVLVVAGGPGTGKTAVALHRAAYLLYTHAERLASSGVLLVGPSNAFLRYVEQVLPSLGETSVVLRTVAELVPGIEATGTEAEEVAAVKGGRRMAGVIAAAVTERQRVPRRDLTLPYEGQPLRLPRGVCHDARRRARASRRPHNQARNIFVRTVLTHLSQQVIEVGLWSELDRGERDGLLRDLIRTPDIRWAVNRLWPHLTAEALLTQLYADGGGGLSPRERHLLARPAGSPWTPADVPLLDEAAELLGETDPWGRRAADRAAARERAEEGYAAEVLGGVGAAGGGFVDAGTLAARYGGADRSGVGNAVDHAAGDRKWAFGHVVVDEAQDLSPMAWRCLVRRCPGRSMTVVGDLAQAGRAWSPSTWKEVLEDTAPGRWRVEELTIGYRTPAEVMTIAGDVLERVDPSLVPPRAIRTAGVPARVRPVPADRPVAPAVLTAVRDERAALGDGQIAVLAPDGRSADALRAALAGALPGRVAPAAAPEPGAEVVVLPVAAGKGLEFDAVVLVDPAAVLASGPRGGNDLYVALTRTTNRLLVLCPGPVPGALARLTPG